MINENIKRARKANGITQEELAVKLNVVRQTVSKWESGLSVPDANILIKLAECLGVTISDLLGAEVKDDKSECLAENLAQVNEELALKNREIQMYYKVWKKRGLILLLSFISMFAAMAVKNEIASIVLTACCALLSVIILYRNIALLTYSGGCVKTGVLQLTSVFNILILMFSLILILLNETAIIRLTESNEKLMALCVISAVMLFGGFISPRLPFNRYTGLRLPWTVQDEKTWNVAHRIIGFISIPLVLLYLAAVCTIDAFEAVTLAAVLLWIGIPGALSLVFYWNKYHVKLR